jgi:hypothetical protein
MRPMKKRTRKPANEPRPAHITVPPEAVPLLAKMHLFTKREPGELVYLALQIAASYFLPRAEPSLAAPPKNQRGGSPTAVAALVKSTIRKARKGVRKHDQ